MDKFSPELPDHTQPLARQGVPLQTAAAQAFLGTHDAMLESKEPNVVTEAVQYPTSNKRVIGYLRLRRVIGPLRGRH